MQYEPMFKVRLTLLAMKFGFSLSDTCIVRPQHNKRWPKQKEVCQTGLILQTSLKHPSSILLPNSATDMNYEWAALIFAAVSSKKAQRTWCRSLAPQSQQRGVPLVPSHSLCCRQEPQKFIARTGARMPSSISPGSRLSHYRVRLNWWTCIVAAPALIWVT